MAPPVSGGAGAQADASAGSTAQSTAGADGESTEAGQSITAGPGTPYSLEEVKSLAFRVAGGSLGGSDLAEVWGEFEQRLALSDIGALASALRDDKDQNITPAIRALFTEWAKNDPQAAWNAALRLSPPDKCSPALHAVLDTVAKANPQNGLAMADGIQNADLRKHMRTSVLRALAAIDPAQAFEIASRQASDGDGSDFAAILGAWAEKDPGAALAAADRLEGRAADQARFSILHSWAQRDPRAAWDYASRLPPSSDRYFFNEPQQRVIDQWADKDPAAALAAALTIQNAERRDYAVSTAVREWASLDFRAALAYAVATKDPILRGRLLQGLAGSDKANGYEMLDVLLEHAPSGDGFENAVSSLLDNWAGNNPQEAAAAALQLPPGQALAEAAPRIAAEWMRSASPDKSQILAWASALPEGYARDRTMRTLFESWSAQDAAGALRAIGSTAVSGNSEALRGLVEGWSSQDPAAAAQWAATLPDESVRDSALRSALSAWSRSSPAQAAAFVQTVDEKNRVPSTAYLVENWASRDASGAAEWLKTQPAGAVKDAGITALAREIAEANPETALAWTKTITDAGQQERETENVLRVWLRYDPAGAKAWAGSNTLPEKVRRSLSGQL